MDSIGRIPYFNRFKLMQIRHMRCLSQVDLAALMGRSKWYASWISRWESGAIIPRKKTLRSLCEALDIGVEALLSTEEEILADERKALEIIESMRASAETAAKERVVVSARRRLRKKAMQTKLEGSIAKRRAEKAIVAAHSKPLSDKIEDLISGWEEAPAASNDDEES
tara:strand:+ start:1416 stop:1919 length:504 start_codon:yes stop_codon:yes gene_type:complete